MRKIKILIVGNSFYPNNDPRSLRTTELVKEFAKQGHYVTVLIPRNNDVHTSFERENGIKIIDLGKSSFKEININYKNNYKRLSKQILKRGLDYFFDYPYIEWMFKVRKKLKNESGYDLLITIAFPHPIHWGAALVRSNSHKIAKTWVADCGDPFMGAENDSFNKPFYFKYFEKMWGRKADYIAIPIEEARPSYYPEFHNKIKVIPQGFSFPENKNIKKKKNKVPTFLYSGNIGSYPHYYKPFFELLNSIDVDFKFIAYTKEQTIYQKYLYKISDKAEIKEYIPREELLIQMQDVDFLIHFPYQKDTQKSLKLVDYSYSGSPILSYKGSKDNKKFQKFLKGNYLGQYPTENIEPYKIENVCKQFLNLTDGGKI